MSKKSTGKKVLTIAATLTLMGNVLVTPITAWAADAEEISTVEGAIVTEQEQNNEAAENTTVAESTEGNNEAATTEGATDTTAVAGNDEIDPAAGISVGFTTKTTITGDTSVVKNGLSIIDGETTGHLQISVQRSTLVEGSIAAQTTAYIYLPDELKELANTKEFVESVSAKTGHMIWGVDRQPEPVNSGKITYNASKHRLEVINPRFTGTIVQPVNGVVTYVDIDLGAAVQKSGVRIPDAVNGKYTFNGKQHGGINLIGKLSDKADLNVQKLDPGYGVEKPEIEFTENRVTEVKVGSDYTNEIALKGVIATDAKDGMITNKLQVKDSQVDTRTPGTYNVTYRVVNSTGLATEKVGQVKVVEGDGNGGNPGGNTEGTLKTADYTLGEANITGAFTGDIDHAKLIVNNTELGNKGGTFSKDGSYSFWIGVNTITSKTDNAVIVAYDKDGNELDRKQVNIKDQVVATSGTINPKTASAGETTITGTYTGDVKQVDMYIDGVYKSSGGTFSNGNFSYYAGSLKAGQKVELVAYDATKPNERKELDRKSFIVQAPAVVTSGTINPSAVYDGDSSVTGSYSGDVKQVDMYIDGAYKSSGGTFSNGNFSYYAGALKAGQKVELVAYDAAKPNTRKELDRKTITVQSVAGSNLKGSFVDAKYNWNTANIEGHFTGDIEVAYIEVDGVVQPWGGTFNSNGSFTYWTKAINLGSKVKIYGYNKTTAHKELATYTFTA
ncbi:cell wall anchor domain-containing protein [Listeria floridensis FSL S10-1187]|uniref:Cell wall anchor domain-containing protein n=1 Tax=Listeria floridensis FSL S10-1187 TaxID=1265817 RepID=A0ABP3B1L2_9LIST|nr:immunoglobulin-like domain-containing protein [Listeria floridensis]EUJ33813.1 cell wall anchor domain-containing protein [Listeria floridensis FSL S10-1187]